MVKVKKETKFMKVLVAIPLLWLAMIVGLIFYDNLFPTRIVPIPPIENMDGKKKSEDLMHIKGTADERRITLINEGQTDFKFCNAAIGELNGLYNYDYKFDSGISKGTRLVIPYSSFKGSDRYGEPVHSFVYQGVAPELLSLSCTSMGKGYSETISLTYVGKS